METIFYNEEEGIWFDFNITANMQQSADHLYASSFLPLWANLYWNNVTENTGIYSTNQITSAVLNYLQENDEIISYPGGLPTSLFYSGQQWDFPNGWAPLNLMFIEGLNLLGEDGEKIATQIARNWMASNFNGFAATQFMYEKYNVTNDLGVPGDGGEYSVQTGFGWTNGVALELLTKYCIDRSFLFFYFFYFINY